MDRDIVIAAPVGEVWEVVSASERQAEWFPGMVSSTLEGSTRTITTAPGGLIREEILGVDDSARSLTYRITGPMHLDHHLGTIDVSDDPHGTRVRYRQELEPKALVYVLDAAVADALEGLKALIETGRTSRAYVPEAG